MDDHPDSTDRRAADYLLFALGFIGFLVAAAGVILASKAVAVIGGFLLLLVVLSFYARSARRA